MPGGRGEYRARAVACPTCGAGQQEKCVSKTGLPAGQHVARYALAVRAGVFNEPDPAVSPQPRNWHDARADYPRQREKLVGVRLTEAEHALLAAEAQRAGKTLPAVLRDTFLASLPTPVQTERSSE